MLNEFNTQIPKRLASQTLDFTPPTSVVQCFSDKKHQLPRTVLDFGQRWHHAEYQHLTQTKLHASGCEWAKGFADHGLWHARQGLETAGR